MASCIEIIDEKILKITTLSPVISGNARYTYYIKKIEKIVGVSGIAIDQDKKDISLFG